MPDLKTKAQGAQKLPPRTAPKETRRLQLIEATIESIAKHGISGTTMKTVTGIAGLSMGIVNFHFQSKDTLFGETLRHLAEEHRGLWRKGIAKAALDPKDKLMAIIEAHFDPMICNRKKLTVWYNFYGEAANRAAYREIMADIDDERWQATTDICHEMIEDGGYVGLNPANITNTIEGLSDGFCLNILLYPDDFNREEAIQRVCGVMAGFFPKHFSRPPACSN